MSSLSTAQSELSLGWQTFSSKGNSLICERWRRGIWPHLTSHISRSLGYAVILWQPPQQQWQSGAKCHTLWLTSNGRQLDLLAGQQRQSKQMDFLNFIKQKAKAERWRQNATTFGIISAVVWDLERWSRGSLEVEAFTYICGLPVVSQFTYYS